MKEAVLTVISVPLLLLVTLMDMLTVYRYPYGIGTDLDNFHHALSTIPDTPKDMAAAEEFSRNRRALAARIIRRRADNPNQRVWEKWTDDQ